MIDSSPETSRICCGRSTAGRWTGTLQTAGAHGGGDPHDRAGASVPIFAHPQVMFILMLVVIYGIIGELTSPGAILPGVAGVIALVLLLYMAAILPMNAPGWPWWLATCCLSSTCSPPRTGC